MYVAIEIVWYSTKIYNLLIGHCFRRSPWLGGQYSTTLQEVVWVESRVVIDSSVWISGGPDVASGTKACAYWAFQYTSPAMVMDDCSVLDVFLCEINFK